MNEFLSRLFDKCVYFTNGVYEPCFCNSNVTFVVKRVRDVDEFPLSVNPVTESE